MISIGFRHNGAQGRGVSAKLFQRLTEKCGTKASHPIPVLPKVKILKGLTFSAAQSCP